MHKGCPYRTHRVIEPKGLLPQPAWKIDNRMEIYDNEVLIDVDVLNIDSASFTGIEEEAARRRARALLKNYEHSGGRENAQPGYRFRGNAIGRVAQIGPALEGKSPLKGRAAPGTPGFPLPDAPPVDRIKKIHKDRPGGD